MRGTTKTSPYTDLPMGEDVLLFPEDSTDHRPIDFSNPNLRQYSPFILEVKPPEQKGEYLSNVNTLRTFQSPLRVDGAPRSRAQLATGGNSFSPRLSSLAGPPISPVNGSARSKLSETIDMVDPAYTDRLSQVDFAIQHRALDTLPPIVFMINPSSFEVSYSSTQAFQEQTRYGFVFQRWGEELPTISISCSIGAFVVENLNSNPSFLEGVTIANPSNLSFSDMGRASKGPNGLTHTARKDSGAFRHLMAIFALYRNSATIADRVGRSRANHAVGRHVIHYDGQTWEGRIESMSYGLEEARQNGGISFDLSFVVYNHKYRDPMSIAKIERLRNLNSPDGSAKVSVPSTPQSSEAPTQEEVGQ
jgi:hypothetical protein